MTPKATFAGSPSALLAMSTTVSTRPDSSAFVTKLPDSPTRHTPNVTITSDTHWYSHSRRPRNMTERTPTQRTRAPRDIWKIDTGVRMRPAFKRVVPHTGNDQLEKRTTVTTHCLRKRGTTSSTPAILSTEHVAQPPQHRPLLRNRHLPRLARISGRCQGGDMRGYG